MNTSTLSKKTVKVISQKIEIDWIHPIKIVIPNQVLKWFFYR